jgi:hypothetical protein
MAINYKGDPFYEEEEFQTFQQPEHFNLRDYPYRGPVQSGYVNTGNIIGYPGEAGYDDNLSFERDFRGNQLADTGVQMAYKTPRRIVDQNRVLGMTFAEDEELQPTNQYRMRDQLKRDFLQGGLFRDAKQSLGQSKDALVEDFSGLQNIIGSGVDKMQEGLGFFRDKAGQGWDFAKQLPRMAMGALTKIPGIGLGIGALKALSRPDSPYQAFQKQMFEEMGWQGDSNKDPWGKNIRSLKDTYDVRDQWGDLMGTKIGEKYGYADAFADGVLDDAELAKMQELGLKGWQLNRAIGLSTAAKKAQDWKDKKNAALELKEKQKEDRKKQQQYKPGDNTINWNPNIQKTGPTYGPHQGSGGGNWGPGGKSPSSGGYSRGSYGGRGHHWARGGRVGYANGGLASLFTRRG